ncbi:hypothetical protein [Rugamonas apoptosis]|uniref:Lipoprotein n=1 Tax=Rugamonas apoptosis TaxID=2758570 RepID=A0A7W2F7R5_9BURK|nr:hypothetical protein [Rugamonas apoptosis]MBA5686696.1 hypothetical protein [Rugamonas apoptosis]
MTAKATSCGVGVAILLAGCAGQLQVFDASQAEIKGVPFKAAEVYVKGGYHDKHSKGGDCAKTAFFETVALPTGAQYFATAKTAQFAKTGFHMKFADNGALAEVGLDSEPAAADTLKATNDLIKTVFPSLGAAAATGGAVAATTGGTAAATAAAPGGGAAPQPKACDAGEDGVTFVKLDDYIKAHK